MKIMFAVFQNFDKSFEYEIKNSCALKGYEVNIDSYYYIEAIHKSINDSYDYLIINQELEVDKALSEDDIIKFKCKNPQLKIVVIGQDEKFEGIAYYTILKENFNVNVITELICSNQMQIRETVSSNEINYSNNLLKEIKEDELEVIFKKLYSGEDLINYFNNLCNKYDESQMLMLISMIPVSIKDKLNSDLKYKDLENKLNRILGDNKENVSSNEDLQKFNPKSYLKNIIKKIKLYT